MSDDKRLSAPGPISKNPFSEFSIEKLSEWLARLNPEFGYSIDKKFLKEMIINAISTGELTIRGNPIFPLPGRCVICHKNHLAEQTIPSDDIEQWCSKKGLIFCTSQSKKLKKEKTKPDMRVKEIHPNSVVARNMLDAAFYNFIESLLQGTINPRNAKRLIKDTTGKITPHGLGTYLFKYHNATSSAGKTIKKALEFAKSNDN